MNLTVALIKLMYHQYVASLKKNSCFRLLTFNYIMLSQENFDEINEFWNTLVQVN